MRPLGDALDEVHEKSGQQRRGSYGLNRSDLGVVWTWQSNCKLVPVKLQGLCELAVTRTELLHMELGFEVGYLCSLSFFMPCERAISKLSPISKPWPDSTGRES